MKLNTLDTLDTMYEKTNFKNFISHNKSIIFASIMWIFSYQASATESKMIEVNQETDDITICSVKLNNKSDDKLKLKKIWINITANTDWIKEIVENSEAIINWIIYDLEPLIYENKDKKNVLYWDNDLNINIQPGITKIDFTTDLKADSTDKTISWNNIEWNFGSNIFKNLELDIVDKNNKKINLDWKINCPKYNITNYNY